MRQLKNKPKVGQIIYSLNVGNATSKYSPQVLTKVEVKRVGTKYFYCGNPGIDNGREVQYHIGSWCESTAYPATSYLYESEAEWHEEVETRNICKTIQDAFEYGRKVSIEKLRMIANILAESEQSNE